MSVKAGSSTPNGSQTFDAIYPGASQVVPLTTSAAKSAATQVGTSVVRLVSSVACFIAIGPNPTATLTTSTFIPANVPCLFAINGGTDFVSGIVSASTGSLYITEGA